MKSVTYPPEASRAPEEPIVSVIMPVYNTRRFLPQSVNSILYQTLGNLELLCIDDKSNDESWDYLSYRAGLDRRMSIWQMEDNGGAGAARNVGLQHARGKYLYFLDSDDFAEMDLLERAVSLAESERSQIVPFRVNRFDNLKRTKKEAANAFRKGNIPEGKTTFAAADFPQKVFNTFLTWPHNKLFLREYVESRSIRFQELHRTNDLLFVQSAMFMADRITPLDRVGINYRVGMSSNSQATNHLHPLDFCRAFAALKGRLEEEGMWDAYKTSFQNSFMGGAVYNLGSIKDRDAAVELYHYLQDVAFPEFQVLEMREEDVMYPDAFRKCAEIGSTPADSWASGRF